MKIKVQVNSVIEMNVDDKYAELANTYPAGNWWDEQLAGELATLIEKETGIPVYSNVSDEDITCITAVYDNERNPMMEW